MSPTQQALLARETAYVSESVRLASALRNCGLDTWSVCEAKDNRFQIWLQASTTPGRWWFRPCWDVGQPFQLLLPVAQACQVISEYAYERLEAGAHPDLYATEDDALALWERLRNLAESTASGGAV